MFDSNSIFYSEIQSLSTYDLFRIIEQRFETKILILLCQSKEEFSFLC